MKILGKEISNKTVIITSCVLLVGLGSYIYWRKKRGKQIYTELMSTVKGTAKGLNVGYSTSETNKPVVWTSPTYWAGKTKMTDDQAKTIVKTIGGFRGNLSNSDSQFERFKAIKTQAEGSKILGYYGKVYKGKSLLFQIKSLKPEYQKKITDYLNNLPLK